MPLANLNLDENYFAKLRARNEPMKGQYFDAQWNYITNYINKELIPFVNNIKDSRLAGINNLSSIGKFLRYRKTYDYDENGDPTLISTLVWDNLKVSDILDQNLPPSKIQKASIGSIMAAAGNGDLIAVSPAESGQLLFSRANASPIWRKIKTSDIPNRFITGRMIAKKSIRQENISPGALNTQLQAGVITNGKIVNNTISRGKFTLGSFTEVVLGNMADTLKAGLFKEALPKNFFNRNLFSDDTKRNFAFAYNPQKFSKDPYPISTVGGNFSFPDQTYWRYVKPRTLSSTNVANNVLSADSLNVFYKSQIANNPSITSQSRSFSIFRHGPGSIIEDGAIRPEHLSDELKTLLGITL